MTARRLPLVPRLAAALLAVAAALFVAGCPGTSTPPTDAPHTDTEAATRTDAADALSGMDATPAPDGGDASAPGDVPDDAPAGAAYDFWVSTVQPQIAQSCAPCHLGGRFAYASLANAAIDAAGSAPNPDAGAPPPVFTAAETRTNYERFFDLLALDNPPQSRLIAKALVASDPRATLHAGGNTRAASDPLLATFLQWATLEKAQRCPECGVTAPRAYIAYLDQPAVHWAINPDPTRTDFGVRTGARIMLQAMDPGTMRPVGAPVDFLQGAFCGPRGDCDFGRSAANYAGTQLAFECRLSLDGAVAYLDMNWTICIAEIGPDGHALNPRFLRPPADRPAGWTQARGTAYGLPGTSPVGRQYDANWQLRRREDRYPAFAPDDAHVVFASRGADPRTGELANETYHGTRLLNNIVSVELDGTHPRTIYRNEGGSADQPFYLRNGNIAFHTWYLDRMDRHMYTQATADGMMELPVLFGRVQGENMWGRAVQLTSGAIVGMTGNRRGSISLFLPFWTDHTLGTGLDPATRSFRILDPALAAEMTGGFAYCSAPPNGANCSTTHFFDDVSYSPDGRALATYNPTRTYYQGDVDESEFFVSYGTGSTLEARLASLAPYLPHDMGIGAIDAAGHASTLVAPASGRSLRYPTWVGRIQAPRIQRTVTDERQASAEIHIADLPLWLSFSNVSTNQAPDLAVLDRIVAVRVLQKPMTGNACLTDNRPNRYAVNSGTYDHPTHLGINNATGFIQFAPTRAQGGDDWGDVPLQSDRSVRLRVPAGQLLLFQGVDARGRVIAQHNRVFALPPGHAVDTSVRRTQYNAQCASCHGVIGGEAYRGVAALGLNAPGMDFRTMAAAAPAVDLAAAGVERRVDDYLHQVRPVLTARCVTCHSGAMPAAELSLEERYSATANYPAGRWVAMTSSEILDSVPAANRVPGYNFSPALAHILSDTLYTSNSYYGPRIASFAPAADLMPWDPAYQNLMAVERASTFYYLGGDMNFGRVLPRPAHSSRAFLLEVLTGEDLDTAKSFSQSPDHRAMLTESELRRLMAVIDLGFPFMTRCDDRAVSVGPNAGQPWGQPDYTTDVRFGP